MTNPVYALCIGVSDYTAFAPSGRFNLPGATRDAFRWQQLCEQHFALSPDQIRVHSAAKGAEPTTRKGIKAGLRWLGTQLGKNKDSSGLLTFSGHGLTMQQSSDGSLEEGMTLALAPSNIKPNLKASLNFQHIEQILFEAIAAERFGKTTKLSKKQEASICKSMENITAVLDACYDQPADAEGSVRALTKAVAPPKMPEPPPKVFARLVLACQLWETAYEIKVANEPIGAFTFAITTMIEQWLTGTDDKTAVTYSRASYGDLVFRARTLINTLGLQEQNPALVGTMNNLALLPFLRPGTEVTKGRTSVAPDGWRRGEEFSSGNDTQFQNEFYVVLWWVTPSPSAPNIPLAQCYVTDDSQETWIYFQKNLQNCDPLDGGTMMVCWGLDSMISSGPQIYNGSIIPVNVPPSSGTVNYAKGTTSTGLWMADDSQGAAQLSALLEWDEAGNLNTLLIGGIPSNNDGWLYAPTISADSYSVTLKYVYGKPYPEGFLFTTNLISS